MFLVFLFCPSLLTTFFVHYSFDFLSSPFSGKQSGIGHAMVNKLHCLVDIILIVFFLGLPCVPSPSLLLFVLFEFHPRHSYQKMRRWVCITRQFFLRFFSISSLTCQQPPSLPHNPHPVFFFFHVGVYFFSLFPPHYCRFPTNKNN